MHRQDATPPDQLDPPWQTGYVPADPRSIPIVQPYWQIIRAPDRVIVRARTRLSIQDFGGALAGTAVMCALAGLVASKTPGPQFVGIAVIALVMGLLGVWSAVLAPLMATGTEPTLIDVDRRAGVARLPRAGREIDPPDILRIECVRYGLEDQDHGTDGVNDTVLVAQTDAGELEHIFLFRSRWRRTGRKIAAALDVPFLSYHVGVIRDADRV